MPNGGPNPILVVRENLAEHIAELEAERTRIVQRLIEVHRELAVSRTLQDVAPKSDDLTDERNAAEVIAVTTRVRRKAGQEHEATPS